MRLTKFMKNTLLAAQLLLTSAGVMAGNIYQDGSEGDAMYRVVEQFLPKGVTPVFLLAGDNKHFFYQMDIARMEKAGVTTDTMAYLFDSINPKLTLNLGVRW